MLGNDFPSDRTGVFCFYKDTALAERYPRLRDRFTGSKGSLGRVSFLLTLRAVHLGGGGGEGSRY